MKTLLIAVLGLASVVRAFECPDLTCAALSYNGTCFLHDGGNPVMNIKFFRCPDPGDVCNIADGNFAWFDTQLQRNRLGSDPSQSAVTGKYITADCIKSESMRQNLNNGRKCKADYECKGKSCEFGYCRGAKMGESCGSHEDCDVELACKAASTWPFVTTCQRLGLHGDTCITDHDCHPKTFCWYKYPTDVA